MKKTNSKHTISKASETTIGSAVIGGAGGAGIYTTTGGIGLAVGGTAISISLLPLIAIGAVIGGTIGYMGHYAAKGMRQQQRR